MSKPVSVEEKKAGAVGGGGGGGGGGRRKKIKVSVSSAENLIQ